MISDPVFIMRLYAMIRHAAFPERRRLHHLKYNRSENGRRVKRLHDLRWRKTPRGRRFKKKNRQIYEHTEHGKLMKAGQYHKWVTSPMGRVVKRCLRAKRRALMRKGKTDKSARAVLAEIYSPPFLPCTYCGTLTAPEARHADHIIALALGGAHTGDNLTPACSSCNCREHAKSIAVWIDEITAPSSAASTLSASVGDRLGADGADRGAVACCSPKRGEILFSNREVEHYDLPPPLKGVKPFLPEPLTKEKYVPPCAPMCPLFATLSP